MRRRVLLTVILFCLTLAPAAWGEEEGIIESVIEACEPEIEAFCSQVMPGEGRLLACFFAHEDKLSGRCGFALYTAAADLEQFAAAITHLAGSCRDDLVKHCGEVELGEGRVASCLLEHKEEVTDDCRQAIDDVGLEVEE